MWKISETLHLLHGKAKGDPFNEFDSNRFSLKIVLVQKVNYFLRPEKITYEMFKIPT